MEKNKQNNIVIRAFITLIGMMFILWGIGLISLGIIGKSAIGNITHVRREGGERNEGIGGRYTYNISYTFITEEGKRIDGVTKRIGDGVYLKNINTFTTVKYLDRFPYVNALKEETNLSIKQAIFISIGILLLYSIKKRKDA